MHSHKTVLFAALFGLSLFVLGLAVGQGWFTPNDVGAQPLGAPYPGPQIVWFTAMGAEAYLVDIEGYYWSAYGTNDVGGPFWTRHVQVLPPNTVIPASSASIGSLKGSYNK